MVGVVVGVAVVGAVASDDLAVGVALLVVVGVWVGVAFVVGVGGAVVDVVMANTQNRSIGMGADHE